MSIEQRVSTTEVDFLTLNFKLKNSVQTKILGEYFGRIINDKTVITFFRHVALEDYLGILISHLLFRL